ncbi:MAG: hypothetical protein HQM16_03545 [Deltaproteobacteria bacterium]|nr:hypothetical protein [Deltaproteobacteria bacterium]
MDADSLIKITKAGLKEFVVSHYSIFIPKIVEIEVVDYGIIKKMPDAFLVKENITRKKISVLRTKKNYPDGDTALQKEFSKKKFDAVSTDDSKLIRFLGSQNIPYILPAVLIYKLGIEKKISPKEGSRHLSRLKPFISPEEFSTVKMLMERRL